MCIWQKWSKHTGLKRPQHVRLYNAKREYCYGTPGDSIIFGTEPEVKRFQQKCPKLLNSHAEGNMLIVVAQAMCLMLGSIIFGIEFGAHIGCAVFCVGYALMPAVRL